jgi:hypothetical protein
MMPRRSAKAMIAVLAAAVPRPTLALYGGRDIGRPRSWHLTARLPSCHRPVGRVAGLGASAPPPRPNARLSSSPGWCSAAWGRRHRRPWLSVHSSARRRRRCLGALRSVGASPIVGRWRHLDRTRRRPPAPVIQMSVVYTYGAHRPGRHHQRLPQYGEPSRHHHLAGERQARRVDLGAGPCSAVLLASGGACRRDPRPGCVQRGAATWRNHRAAGPARRQVLATHRSAA